jgi:hypothetical protein
MRTSKVFRFIFWALFSLTGASAAANSGITYQGRLLKPDNTPVTSASVQFKLQIRTPGAQDCLMYEEIQSADLSLTSGVFALSLGDGTGVRQDSYPWSLFDALSNRKAFNFSAGDCTGPNSYTPAPEDNRRFRVFFDVGSGWEALPVQTINYIPMSIETYAVGGFPASSLLRVEDAGSLVNTTPLSNAQYVELLALLGGSSGQYEHAGELGGSALPSLGAGQTMVSDGSGGWSAALPLTSESDPTVQAFAQTALPTCTTGEALVSNGTMLSCVSVASGSLSESDIPKLTSAGNGVDGGAISGEIGGSTSVNTSGDLATTGDISAGGDIAAVGNVSAGSVSTGSLSTTGGITSAGDVSVTGVGGKVSATNGEFRRLHLLDDQATPHYVEVRSPDPLTANYTLTLPGSLGSANQILGMNNAGNALENKTLTAGTGVTITHSAGGIEIAASGSGGTVTSVTGTAPIVVDNSNPNTPIVSLDDSGVGVGTYGSATEVPVITVDAKGRITSASNTTISGVSPAGSNLATGKAWIGDGTGKATEAYINVSDLKKSDGTPQIPSTCTASQTMTWSSVTDVFTCSNITVTKSQISDFPTLGTAALEDVGTSAGDVVQLDPSGKLPAVDGSQLTNLTLPSYDTTYFKQGGNDFSATATLGTTGNNDLNITTNNTPKMTVLANGNVGIGTTAPSYKVDVNGEIASTYLKTSSQAVSILGKTGNWSSFTSGYVKLKTKVPWTGMTFMSKIRLDGWYYGGSRTYEIGFYLYDYGTGLKFYSPSLETYGNFVTGKVWLTEDNGYVSIVFEGYPWGAFGSVSVSIIGAPYAVTPFSKSLLEGWAFVDEGLPGSPVDQVQLTPKNSFVNLLVSGNMGIGTTAPVVSLDLGNKTDALKLPAGTTAQQPATSSNGMIRYNSSSNKFEAYENGAWINMIGGTASSATSVAAGAGSAATPSISFSADADTGFYSSGTNSLGISAGGNKVWDITTSAIVSPTAGGASISSAAGTAAAPTFSFSGDTDTGWYLAAPDTLAASTGGTERIRIDSNGNVGIGTTTLTFKMNISSNANSSSYIESTGTSGVAAIAFGQNSGGSQRTPAFIGVKSTGTGGENKLRFAVGSNIGPSSANFDTGTRMTIDGSTGNVGIGTSAPQTKLVLQDNASGTSATFTGGVPLLRIQGSGSWSEPAIDFGEKDLAPIASIAAKNTTGGAGDLIFLTRTNGDSAAIEKMRIKNDGSVGIGTTAPSGVLNVAKVWGSTSSTNLMTLLTSYGDSTRLTFQRANGTMASPLNTLTGNILGNINFRGYDGTGFSSNADASILLTAAEDFTSTAHGTSMTFATTPKGTTSTATRMAITSEGNVGIGTTNPTGSLDVRSSATGGAVSGHFGANPSGTGSGYTNILTLDNLYGTGNFKNTLKFASVGSTKFAIGNDLNGIGEQNFFIQDVSNSQTRFVIDGSGNVGIGTTNPTQRLEVSGNASITGGTNPYLLLKDSTPSSHYIQVVSGKLAIGNNGSLTIDSTGKVGIGTTTPAQKLDVWGNIAVSGATVHTSDRRLKENITPITDALNKILTLKGYNYYWKDKSLSERRQIGVIAQEVKKVFPEAVYQNSKTGYYSVNYEGLIPPLIESTKELYGLCEMSQKQLEHYDREIASLKEQLAVKDRQIDDLTRRMEALEKLMKLKIEAGR